MEPNPKRTRTEESTSNLQNITVQDVEYPSPSSHFHPPERRTDLHRQLIDQTTHQHVASMNHGNNTLLGGWMRNNDGNSNNNITGGHQWSSQAQINNTDTSRVVQTPEVMSDMTICSDQPQPVTHLFNINSSRVDCPGMSLYTSLCLYLFSILISCKDPPIGPRTTTKILSRLSTWQTFLRPTLSKSYAE